MPEDDPTDEETSSWPRAGSDFSATSFVESTYPAVDDGEPVEVTSETLRAGGDFSATSSTAIIPSAVDDLWTDEYETEPTHNEGDIGLSFPAVDDWAEDDDGPSYTNHWGYYYRPHRPTGPQIGGPADISSLESGWEPIPPPRDVTTDINSWDTDIVLLSTLPDPSDIGETARHASRLLEAFSTGAIPLVAGALSTTQQRLLSAALTLILAITPDNRVNAATQTDPPPPPVDTSAQTDPLPPPVDLAMRPDSTCVVCFTRMATTVLAPCWHLVLCAVCIYLLDRIMLWVLTMRVLLGMLFGDEDQS